MAGSPILKWLSRSVLLWVGGIFVVVGTMLVCAGAFAWQEQERFKREAVEAQARILGKSLERAGRDGNPRTKYLVTYRFSSADGRVVEQTAEVAVDEWERLDEGSLFTVRYLPSDPNVVQTDAGQERWEPLMLGAIGALFTLIGALIGWPELRRAAVVFRVSRRGLTTQGIVLEVRATGTTINRVRQWQLSYAFRDHVGRMQQGKSDLLSPEEAEAWKPGDQGTVRFDREQPQDSVGIGTP
jgi:hypothetical protein